MKLLEIIVVLLLVLWVIGFTFHIAGDFVHILLVIAVIFFIVRLLKKSN